MSGIDRQSEPLPISKGMEEASALLRDQPELLERLSKATSLRREDFQSSDFKRAGYHLLPDRYPNHDRSIWQADLSDGSQIIIISGKVANTNDNPYELGAAAEGGIDLRETLTTIAEWDGEKTIRMYSQGQVDIYTGEYGNPNLLLEATRAKLGEFVSEIRFA